MTRQAVLRLTRHPISCGWQLSNAQRISTSSILCRATKPSVKLQEDVEVDTKRAVAKYGSLPPIDEQTEKELFRDFKFYLKTMPTREVTDERFKHTSEKGRPLVILLGWAGANNKNLSKYTDIYEEAGCMTLNYILPTRFIFNIQDKVPYIASRLVDELQKAELYRRPTFFHLFSDAGTT